MRLLIAACVVAGVGCGFEHGQLDGSDPGADAAVGPGSGSDPPPTPTGLRTCAYPDMRLRLCLEFNDPLVVLDGSDGHLDPSASGLQATMRPATPPDPAVRVDDSASITVREGIELDIPDKITLEAWIRPASFNSANLIRNSGQYRMTINDAGYIGCEMAGKEVHSYASDMVLAGEWHHVACTFDGLQKQIRVFIDGSTRDCVGNTSPAISKTGTSGTEIAPDFTGDIDGVRIYARDLGATGELCTHANATGCQKSCNAFNQG